MSRFICRGMILVVGILMLTFTACKEAPSVFPLDTILTVIANPPGYYYPLILNVAPADGSTEIAVNSSCAVVFSTAIDPTTITAATVQVHTGPPAPGGTDLVFGVDFTTAMNASDTIMTITFIGAYSPLPVSTDVTVTLTGGITDASATPVPLNNPGSFTFTTGTIADTTQPAISAGTENPTGAGVFLTNAQRLAALPSQRIEITFDKATIDPSTANMSTFYLYDNAGGFRVPSTYAFAYTATTTTVILTPTVNLAASTAADNYTVTVTTGIKDLANNSLSAGLHWNFTTTATPLDPVPGAPTFVSGPLVDYAKFNALSQNEALISWTNNETTRHRVYYGLGDDITAAIPGAATWGEYSDYHAVTLGPTLTANHRYWFKVRCEDNSFTPTAPVDYPATALQFNTESDDSAGGMVIIDDGGGTGSQHTARRLIQHPVNGNPTGFFLFWTSNTGSGNDINGQVYSSALAAGWNGGSPQPLYNGPGNYAFQSAAEDGYNGVIVTAISSTDGYTYAKRFSSSGASSWGYASNADGFQVAAGAISNISAVPVYNGITQTVTSGTTEMGSLGLNNPFFDDDQNLSGLTDGDIIMDRVNHDGTVIDNNTVVQDFIYMLGQNSNIIAAGDTYYIGSAANNITYTARDHQILNTIDDSVNVDYVTGPTDLYTDHGATLPGGWTLGLNDIIRNGTSYDWVTGAPIARSLTPFINNGTAQLGSNNTTLFVSNWPAININDRAVNRTDSIFSNVTSITQWLVPFETELGLSANTQFDWLDIYDIYQIYCADHSGAISQFDDFYQININSDIGITSGTSFTAYDYTGPTGTAQAIPLNPLLDNDSAFLSVVAPLPVVNGDVVVNTTDSTSAVVTSATYNHALGLDSNIMADNENYTVNRYRYATLATGRCDAGSAGNSIVDAANNFPGLGVQVGDIAYNPATNQYAVVSAVAANTLTLSSNAGFADTIYYGVFHCPGVLFVYESGGAVMGQVIEMEGTPPAQLVAPFAIQLASNSPKAIPDGNGNAIVIYRLTATQQIYAELVNLTGATTAGPFEIDTQNASTETILDVQSDNAGGAVILYKLATNSLRAQRITLTPTASTRQWGVNGRQIVFMATSQEAMEYVAAGDDVIVTANDTANNIYAWRRDGAAVPANEWAMTPTATGTAHSPKIYYDTGAATAIILWYDDRFYAQPYISTGQGIFGLKVNAVTGAIDAAWNAADSGTADWNGVSIIFNHYNILPPMPIVAPYNNGDNGLVIWEDYRAGKTNSAPDLRYLPIDGFTPP